MYHHMFVVTLFHGGDAEENMRWLDEFGQTPGKYIKIEFGQYYVSHVVKTTPRVNSKKNGVFTTIVVDATNRIEFDLVEMRLETDDLPAASDTGLPPHLGVLYSPVGPPAHVSDTASECSSV